MLGARDKEKDDRAWESGDLGETSQLSPNLLCGDGQRFHLSDSQLL